MQKLHRERSQISAPMRIPARDRRRGSLADSVYEEILQIIVDGEVSGNKKLPTERELAAICNVSRSVVREALSQFRDDGIIYSRQGSGSYLRRCENRAKQGFAPACSLIDVEKCFEFRAAVESEAAAIAAKQHDADSLKLIESALKSMQRGIRNGHKTDNANYAFHLAVAKATQNRFFISTVSMLHESMIVSMKLDRALSSLWLEGSQEFSEHEEIYAAIFRGNALVARSIMLNHVISARRRIFAERP